MADQNRMNTETADPYVVSLLQAIFNQPEAVEELTLAFESLVQETIARRPQDLLASDRDRLRDPLWMLDEVQYLGYVNFMGEKDGNGTFTTLACLVDYIAGDLGATLIHALPFLKSPFGDAGFDVADYRDVDPRFGGMEAFKKFRQKLAQSGGALQMDLVLNHVSVEHKWAQNALAGNPYYKSYFHILNQAPEVVKVTMDATGLPLSAQYREVDRSGKETIFERRVVFPAFADPAHPHYAKLKDHGGQDIWVFHTFYPFQWDLNFTNPQIMREALGVLAFWANEGADILRLDAIPHLFKQMESDPRIMKVVELLRYFLAKAAPRTSLTVEANQAPAVVAQYFGKPLSLTHPSFNEVIHTSSGAQAAYNFDHAIHTWASLLTGEKIHLLEGLRRTPEAPANTHWVYFLRSHDELSLSKAPDKIREIIQRELIDSKRGVPFRGARGVGGRMANFLDHDPRRQKMAFAHLMSVNGHPMIYYGDEIMAQSDHNYARAAAEARGGDQYDSRDEGRGPIGLEAIEAARRSAQEGANSPAGEVLSYLRRLITVRKQRLSLRRGDLQEIETSHDSVVAYMRTVGHQSQGAPQGQESTLVVFNLSGEVAKTRIKITLQENQGFDLITEQSIALEMDAGTEARTDGSSLALQPYQALWLALPAKTAK